MLGLAARGLTTRQIADRLVISPKTADRHIQHVYGKIGVSTRAAAALWAMQHDVVGLIARAARPRRRLTVDQQALDWTEQTPRRCETPGSRTRRCVSGDPACRRASCSAAVGRHTSSTIRVGSPRPTRAAARGAPPTDGAASRWRVPSSSITTFTSVSLKSECSLRFAEPTVSHRSSTIPIFA